MMSTPLNVYQIAARRRGMTINAYMEKIESGHLWCSRCKIWHTADQFGSESEREHRRCVAQYIQPKLDPDSSAGQVLEYMRKIGVGYSRDVFIPLGLSQQRVNQAFRELAARGLVRFDTVRSSRGHWCKRWEFVKVDTAEIQAPRTTVERAIAARPQLFTVWMPEGARA